MKNTATTRTRSAGAAPRRAKRSHSAELAAAVTASAGEQLAKLDDFAAVNFEAALTKAEAEELASGYTAHGANVRYALAVLTKDAHACHELASKMKADGECQSLMDLHDSIEETAQWLRMTADMMTKATYRIFAGIARSITEDAAR